ncbi:hypothetical protein H4R18_000668 [Coemansia javaensis]|uniref:Metallo-beta-lactamase domain-containing protein n=1 Tax=Coemansia javaensis TaxID=2761396 RepID=A0A9W8HKH8_9FUNG|nr:hypothetical protein H4R18_000668 [Coemansia javaensis]
MPRVKRIVFLGTGTSGSIPNVPCITSGSSRCKTCRLSLTAEGRKNRRRNTSLLVCVDHPDGRQRNILIDAGKTFYEGAIEHFAKHDIRTIDAVILTHGHADAMLGLDDLRPWTSASRLLPIYCDHDTLKVVRQTFPYMVDTSKATGSGAVSRLEFRLIESVREPFEVCGVAFQPLRVEHGRCSDGSTFYFNGYRFADVSYISDCSHIPDATRELVAGSRLIILDCLEMHSHSSHFGYLQAVDEARRFRPPRMLLTDINHNLEHSQLERLAEKLLAEEGLVVDPAYDGMSIDLLC